MQRAVGHPVEPGGGEFNGDCLWGANAVMRETMQNSNELSTDILNNCTGLNRSNLSASELGNLLCNERKYMEH